MPGVIEEVDRYIEKKPFLLDAVEKIKKIIYGYETTFGMELLGTVQWVCSHEKVTSEEDVVKCVHEWNDRKKTIMSKTDITRAYEHLERCNLV